MFIITIQSHQGPAINKVHYSLYRYHVIEIHLRKSFLFSCFSFKWDLIHLSGKSYEDHQPIPERGQISQIVLYMVNHRRIEGEP